MALRNGSVGSPRTPHRLAVELGIVAAALVGVLLWQRVATEATAVVFGTPGAFGSLFVNGLVSAAVLLGGLVVLVGAYAAVRDLDVGLRLPARRDLPVVGLAAVVPVVLVALTKAVGALTGVEFNGLVMMSVAADAALGPVVLITGLGLLVGVPALALTCQVLVQRSFERVVGRSGAVAATTLVGGFVMVSDTGGLASVPETGPLAGVVLLALLVAGALFVTERTDDDRVRALAALPALALVTLIGLSAVVEITSIAGAVFGASQLAVLAVAAYTYARTDSLLVPALAYASFRVASGAVVVGLEAGLQSW
jgi:hypothetical protein